MSSEGQLRMVLAAEEHEHLRRALSLQCHQVPNLEAVARAHPQVCTSHDLNRVLSFSWQLRWTVSLLYLMLDFLPWCRQVSYSTIMSIYAQECTRRVRLTMHKHRSLPVAQGYVHKYVGGTDVLMLSREADLSPCIMVRLLLEHACRLPKGPLAAPTPTSSLPVPSSQAPSPCGMRALTACAHLYASKMTPVATVWMLL